MSFPQFAFNNVRRNFRAYFTYFLSSAVMIMIFFAYSLFIYHPDLAHSNYGNFVATGMRIASYVVYVFSFFFVLYSISAFLKSRNQEFGILTILGARTGQINRLIFLENMLIGISSIITGVLGGMLISKLFLLITSKIIGEAELRFYWPGKALMVTSIAFLLLFIAVSIFMLVFIRHKNVLELLKGSVMPKKEPKVSWFLSILGASLLILGMIAVTGKYSKNTLMYAAVTGIAGTYFFYTQLSVVIVRLLKKNRSLTWRNTNLLRISEMSYKLKDNARMLFMVTVATAIACMVSSVLLFLAQTNSTTYKNSPYALIYTIRNANSEKGDRGHIVKELNASGVHFTEQKLDFIYYRGFTLNGKPRGIDLLPLSAYRLLSEQTGLPGIQNVSGSDGVLILSHTTNVQNYEDFAGARLQSKQRNLTVNQKINTDILPFGPYSSPFLIVSDTVYKELLQEPNLFSQVTYYLYKIPAWDGAPPSRHDPEVTIGTKLVDWNQAVTSKHNFNLMLHARGDHYQSSRQGTAMMGFIGVFIALIFSLSSASFLYFKLHTELQRDQQMYRSLSKIGLAEGEMSKAATTQIALLFYIPILAAIVETLVVVVPILHGLNQTNILPPILITAAAFTAVQTIYFLLVRMQYIRSLRKLMV
ncbi:ABC transporter permease [Paenibacillus donghaensis]|uniref:FtsX-like permease family protein n=1 Tax=Paenibacillus donghaensis TaxID=414771 RepID=UPI0018836B5C|nr:ABC transporter permease [Paenibacillus donghaensis]MBE9916550.1 ABC transporter permease [Paenibacillus donghaensis]